MESFRTLGKIEKIKQLDINLENIYPAVNADKLEEFYNLLKNSKISEKIANLLEDVCNHAVLPINSMYALDFIINIDKYKRGEFGFAEFVLNGACNVNVPIDNIPEHFNKNDFESFIDFKEKKYPLDIFYNEKFASLEVYDFAAKCYANGKNPFDYIDENNINYWKIRIISDAFDEGINLKEYIKDFDPQQLTKITKILKLEEEGFFINKSEIINKEFNGNKIGLLLEAVKENCSIDEFKKYSNEDCDFLTDQLDYLFSLINDETEIDVKHILLQLSSCYDVEKTKAIFYAIPEYISNIDYSSKTITEKDISNLINILNEHEPKKAIALFLLDKSGEDIECLKDIETKNLFLKLDVVKCLDFSINNEIFKLDFENAFYYILGSYYIKHKHKPIDIEKFKTLKPEECKKYFDNSIKNNMIKLIDGNDIDIDYKYYDGEESVELPNGYKVYISEQSEEPDIELLSSFEDEGYILEKFYSENIDELEMLVASSIRPTLDYNATLIVENELEEPDENITSITSIADIIDESGDMLEDIIFDDNSSQYCIPHDPYGLFESFELDINDYIPQYEVPTGEILILEKDCIQKEYGPKYMNKIKEILDTFKYECKLYKCYDEEALYQLEVYDEEDNYVTTYDCIFAEDIDDFIKNEIIPEYNINYDNQEECR